TPSPAIDRRRPLPSTFAASFIDNRQSGFLTSFKIWRETAVEGNAACAAYVVNGAAPLADVVRFDEHENATVMPRNCAFCFAQVGTSSASSIPSSSPLFPAKSASGDSAGWLYLNLDLGGIRPSQSWVIASMSAPPSYAVDVAAPALGNGC